MTTTAVPVPHTGQTVKVYANDAYNHTVLNLSAFTMYIGENTPLQIGVNAIPIPPGGSYPITDHGPLYALNPASNPDGLLQINDQVGQYTQVISYGRSPEQWGPTFDAPPGNGLSLSGASGTAYGNCVAQLTIKSTGFTSNGTSQTFAYGYHADGSGPLTSMGTCPIPSQNGNSNTTTTSVFSLYQGVPHYVFISDNLGTNGQLQFSCLIIPT